MAEVSLQEIHEAVNELRTEVDKKSVNLEKVEKINTFLDEQEALNQKHFAEQKAAEKREEEYKERLDALEVDLARKMSTETDGKAYKQTEEYKALESWVREGDNRISLEQKNLLRTDVDTAGGYLVTGELDNMITKQITEISNIRSIARVRTISKKTLSLPIRKTIPTATYEGEAEAGGEGVSSYGIEDLTAFRQTITIPVTMDQLMDSSFDMESEILGDASESFAKGEGSGHVIGTGHKQPEGFTVNADVVAGARTSSTSGTITADDIILLTGDLKTGYDPTYVMNRKTLAFLRTLKSTDGVFLWQPGMNGPVANTINGFPYLLAQDMADIASNSLSVAFGDFRRGYTIIDRTGVSVIRDELTRKKEAVVEYTIHRWNYGKVTLPEAITLLKTAA